MKNNKKLRDTLIVLGFGLVAVVVTAVVIGIIGWFLEYAKS